MDKILKDFQFHIPVELVKGKKEDEGDLDSWKIQGIASTNDEDLQGETVDQDGLDISMLRAGRGLFNFDHQKGPENVIGQIDDGDFINFDGKKALFVKGYLFKHQDRGKAFYNILRSLKKGGQNRVHFSVEGKIIRRDLNNPKNIVKARIDKIALTLDPVNPVTYCSLMKSLGTMNVEPEVESVEKSNKNTIEIDLEKAQKLIELAQKALSAGVGYEGAPKDMKSGEAMTTESLERKPKKINQKEKKKKNKMLKSMIEDLRQEYPDKDPLELAKWTIEIFVNKLTEGR